MRGPCQRRVGRQARGSGTNFGEWSVASLSASVELGAQLREAEAARMRERLREIHAEIAALATQVDDPDLRVRIAALADRVRGPAAGDPSATLAVTPRELDVVTQVAAGLSNFDVAVRIGLTPATVKSYLKSAMRKAGVHNRMALVSSCRRAGLIP